MKALLFLFIACCALNAQTQPFKILDELIYGKTIQELKLLKDKFSLVSEDDDKLVFSKVDSTDINELTLKFKDDKLNTMTFSFTKNDGLQDELTTFYTQETGQKPKIEKSFVADMIAWKTENESILIMTMMGKLALTVTSE